MKTLKLLGIFAVLASILGASIPAIATDVPVTAEVSGYVSLTFSDEYSSIDFGSVAQNSNDNAGADNTYYHINVTTNGNATLTWSQGNLVSGVNTLPKANVKITYDVDTPASTNPATATAMGSDVILYDLSNGEQVYANYWLDVPALQASGSYSGNQTVTANAV